MKPLLQTLLLVSALYLMGCGGFGGSDNSKQGVFTTDIQKFSSCAELRATTNTASSMYMDIMPATADAGVPVSGPANNQIYDNQSANVMESDRVLINSTKLFVLRKSSLEIFSRGSFQRTHVVQLESANKNTLFVDDQNVVVVSSNDYLTTKVSIYDASTILLRKQFVLEGLFEDVRKHENQLILLANSYSYMTQENEGALNPNQTIVSPNCNEIYQSQTNAYSSGLTLLYNIHLDDFSKAPSSTGFAGYTNLMYMSENALYLASNSYYTFPSHIRQIKWTKDSVRLNSVATYFGAIKDRWAMNEYADSNGIKLAIATTISQTSFMPAPAVVNDMPASTNRINYLLVFSENNGHLSKLSESNYFGANEAIQSVRFVGDLAYVVTFRLTDPLFIFDLSDRGNIRQLGELKVPGFSTHLRPLTNHYLLGVGYDTQDSQGATRQAGIQVSLFDVNQTSNPIRKNVFTLGVRGSYSDATMDSHALLYDSGTGLIGLPIVELINPYANDPFSWGTKVGFAGAQMYRFGPGGQLTEVGRISHSKWRSSFSCDDMLFNGWSYGSSDINRIIMVDGKLVTISQFGLMVHNPESLTIISEQMFTPRTSGFCYEPGFQW
jgi:inhibitor of cysteine peptidase